MFKFELNEKEASIVLQSLSNATVTVKDAPVIQELMVKMQKQATSQVSEQPVENK